MGGESLRNYGRDFAARMDSHCAGPWFSPARLEQETAAPSNKKSAWELGLPPLESEASPKPREADAPAFWSVLIFVKKNRKVHAS